MLYNVDCLGPGAYTARALADGEEFDSTTFTVLAPFPNGEEVEFDETKIFFEFNATDLDLGLHLFFDAEGWEEVEVSGSDGTIFTVRNDGSLKEIGSTEVFTESVEPPLDEENLGAAIAEFLARFPAGEYGFKGRTVEGDRLVGTAVLTHALPAAPGLVFPDPEAGDNVANPESE